MPVARNDAHDSERDAYQKLWQAMAGKNGNSDAGAHGVARIPKSHRSQWPLWLDHFDTLWLTIAHAIPSDAADNARSDVSLYDHGRATAALAVALWHYHRGDDDAAATIQLDAPAEWDTDKFLLIEGDFSGIQDFVFGGDGITQKNAARLLRGRSALVSLLSEIAALALLEELALPPTSQVINAAGHFQIVAPNTTQTQASVKKVQARFDDWFLKQMFGLGGIVLATTPAACADFTNARKFSTVTRRLWQNLEIAKRHMFDLTTDGVTAAVRTVDFSAGPCPFDGRLPASANLMVHGERVHLLSKAAIDLGRELANPEKQRVLVFRADNAPKGSELLAGEFFGYKAMLTGEREASGNFGQYVNNSRLRRAWDISLPNQDPTAVAWQGYSRRVLSAYVPIHSDTLDVGERYKGLDPVKSGQLKTFEQLARDDQAIDAAGQIIGVEALGVLKGDIDDLGTFFQAQGQKQGFTARAEMSRRISSFFTIWVPSLLAREQDYRNTYTVFAGGDDFLFIGPWRSLRRFAKHLRDDFGCYVASNQAIHFSAGYAMVKPGHPVRALAEDAECLLDKAKNRKPKDTKNAFALFDAVIPWPEWDDMVEQAIAAFERHIKDDELSTAYLYGLLNLAAMAADNSRPENARWRSRLFYQTRRHFERVRTVAKENREDRAIALIREIGEKGLQCNPQGFWIALFDQLYARRD